MGSPKVSREVVSEIFSKQDMELVDSWKSFFKHGKATVKCLKCNQVFKKKIKAAKKTGCLICSKRVSKGEELIAKYLDGNGFNYQREYTFKDCKDKSLLPFDFALFQKGTVSILIEFDGAQHFKAVEYFGGEQQFINQKRRDSIKDKYCHDNNIRLLRISYKEVKRINEILQRELYKG